MKRKYLFQFCVSNMKRWAFVLWLSLFTGKTLASECPASDNESVLQLGYEYRYHFQTEALGEAVGTTNDRSRMTIECSVHILHVYECFYQLKLEQCTLSARGGPPNSETSWMEKKELQDLSRFPVVFTLANGEIKHVYTDEGDPIYFVNVKRGALSAFIFKLSATKDKLNKSHVDVHGTCPWHSVPTGQTNGHVKAYKDMQRCSFPSRPDWQLSPWSLFWNMSFIQYQINSTFECDYKIDIASKVLEKVHCKERHAIGLESTHRTTTAVQTNIHYHMTLEQISKMKSTEELSLPSRHTDIRFEYEKTPEPEEASQPRHFQDEADKMLSDLVGTSAEEVHLSTIPKFTNFVAWLRTSHNLQPFIERVQRCSFLQNHLTCTDNVKELAMSYLSDALVQCNTVPCSQALSILVENVDLSDFYLNFVLYSWNNMHYTKPAIISYVKKICEAKNTRFCWLVLGTMVQNYRGENFQSEKQKELVEVTRHFYDRISPYCGDDSSVAQLDEQQYYSLMTNLKAIGNIGPVYSSECDHVRQLLRCASKDSLPMPLRVVAIEVMQGLDVCQNTDACEVMYQTLKSIFHAKSSGIVSLRIAAYNQLMLIPENLNVVKDLVEFLQIEKNTQLSSYVASDLSARLSDAEFLRDHKEFCQRLTSLLKTREISLYASQNHWEKTSKSTEDGSFYKIPFLPDDIQGFGMKQYSSVIYSFYNMIPQSLKTKVSFELFSKVIDFIEVGGNIEGLHALQPFFEKVSKEMHGKPMSLDLFIRILTIAEEYLTSEWTGSSYEEYPFKKNIVENIQIVHTLFRQHHMALKPYVDIYLKTFGNTLNMFTSSDLQRLKSLKNQIPSLLDKLKQGLTYNHTRVIRVIEAYHQVPTIMGLPLNWTTNATLAFSLRKGLLLSFAKEGSNLELHGNGFFHPSIALTFLNRMVLDFPSITQIGVQANSSGFTSTQWKARIDYSDANQQRVFSVEVPQKTQSLLELYRTNQLIKHDNYDDIPDWDIERTSASWCSSEKFSSIFGLEICHERTYPKVTNLIKPWALMAGSCTWILQARLFDKDLKSYNFNLKKMEDNLERKTELIFNAPGSLHRRTVALKLTAPLNSEDMTASIQIEELPEFAATLSNIQLFGAEDTTKGRRVQCEVKFAENMKYNLVYHRENNSLIFNEGTTDKNKSPKPKKVFAMAQETILKFETPYNVYNYNCKMHLQGRSLKADISFTYGNHHSAWNWLPQFLPPNLWATDKKAWLRLQFNSRGHSPRTITCSIKAPKSSVLLTSNSRSMPGRSQIYVNLTKVDSSNQLLSFANVTYDFWSSASDTLHAKQIQIVNITIPRISWSLRTKTIIEDTKTLYDAVFTRAQMKPRSDVDGNEYIGWWSDEMKDSFDLSLQEFRITANVQNETLGYSELSKKIQTLREDDISGLNNRLIGASLMFSYPVNHQSESVNFDGYFIISNSDTVFRYQKDFVLLSSYHNLRLNSYSVYKSENKDKLLSHNSHFTHLGSETTAFYNLDYREIHHTIDQTDDTKDIDCYDVFFNHNISSHVVDFASNLSYNCDVTDPERTTLILNMDSTSDLWDKLNVRLRQKIDGTKYHSHETVSFNHPLLNIEVTADWRGSQHNKKAIFTWDKQPAMILSLEATIPWETKLVLDIPSDHGEGRKIIFHRRILDYFGWSQFYVYFPDEQHEALTLEGQISNPHKRIWILEVFPKTPSLFNFLKGLSNKLSAHTASMTKDSNHPLNKVLKPALKMPLSQYFSTIKKDVQIGAYNGWNSIKTAIGTLAPIYETPVYIMARLSSAGWLQAKKVYATLEDKSITIWAIKYFQLPQLFQRGLMSLPQGFAVLQNMLLPTDESRKFVLDSDFSFYWKSFRHMPRFGTDSPYHQLQNIRSHNHRFAKSKVAMIYGPRHVYTFDRLLYEFPVYPSDNCAFLLAHDVHQSRFSVVSTADAIHALFSEMTVTIDSHGHVYVNGSEKQQSLPLQSMNRNIFVKQEGKILKVSSPDLTILCETRDQLCTLELNAWNGGGIIGLLGNADGEISNEYMVPDGSVASNVVDFAVPYELSGKPQCRNLQTSPPPEHNHDHESQCIQGLQVFCDSYEKSKKHFYSSCLTNMKEFDNGCPSIMAMAAMCYFSNEVMVTKCDVPQQESRNVRHKLEVILVVNEHASMVGDGQMALSKGMESLVMAIKQQFQSRGYANIHFSMIGFCGSGVHFHPSVHTVGNNVWVTYKAIPDLLKTLNFKGTVKGNPITAVRYAIETLGFDTFDSKIIIVITNQDHQETKQKTLHLIQNYLDKNSITLYTLASYPSIEKGKKVFGVRADGLMFPSNKDEEAYIDYPHGDLAKLVSGTKGSLFLQRFMQQNGPPSFFTEIAQEIWAKVRKELNYCRSCKTIRSGWWYFYNECALGDCNAFMFPISKSLIMDWLRFCFPYSIFTGKRCGLAFGKLSSKSLCTCLTLS